MSVKWGVLSTADINCKFLAGAGAVGRVRMIRGRAPLLLDRADAIGQARTIGALYESGDEGRAVSLCS